MAGSVTRVHSFEIKQCHQSGDVTAGGRFEIHRQKCGRQVDRVDENNVLLNDEIRFQTRANLGIELVEKFRALRIVGGLENGAFEITFPRRFAYLLKIARALPYRLYFVLTRQLVKP